MLFNSGHFLLFFPLVTLLYFFTPHRWRWALLLAASCYFYMVFRPIYILILIFTITVDYFAGLLIESSAGRVRKYWLIASILANTGALAIFKYYNFLNENLRALLHTTNVADPLPFLSIILPIGLSFHVFQSLSYTIEVYRGRYPAEHHAGYFALYVMYYPQLVAGPIERPQNLLPQFKQPHTFDYDRVVEGLQMMLWGFFKKVVVADHLAPLANQVFDHPHRYQGISLVVGTLAFAIQIYCDFSGYSDIALGSSKVMGITLMTNFNRPYFSKSIAEFWKRWHISLSTWFRDYLYVSLGGNRVSKWRWYFNLFLTFLVSGLWHGANWTYVIWGGLNGIYLIGEAALGKVFANKNTPSKRWPKLLPVFRAAAILRTFMLTCFAWVFFRAHSFSDSLYVLRHFFAGWDGIFQKLQSPAFVKMNVMMEQDKTDVLIAVCAVAVLFLVDIWQRRGDLNSRLAVQPAWVRWPLYYAIVAAVLFFGAFNSAQQFIYFQF